MYRSRIIVAALCLVSLLAACGEGGGTATGHTENCRSSSRQGRCEGSYKKITGRMTYEIEELAFSSGTPVEVEIELSVKSGALRVELAGPGGDVSSAVATPSEAISLSGVTLVNAFESAPVVLQVVEGEMAEGISYAIVWAVQ